VFASLSALVYQHTLIALALPTRLVLPQQDLGQVGTKSENNTNAQMQQLLQLGAACNVHYLFTMETDQLTGPQAVKKTVSQLFLTRPLPAPAVVHFKVSGQGITLTDQNRKLFFRKHYGVVTISHCGLDPEDRRWSMKDEHGMPSASNRLFGFVARKPASRSCNQCHVFAELDPDQPARAIVNFVNKLMLSGNSANARADIV
jgi:tensin